MRGGRRHWRRDDCRTRVNNINNNNQFTTSKTNLPNPSGRATSIKSTIRLSINTSQSSWHFDADIQRQHHHHHQQQHRRNNDNNNNNRWLRPSSMYSPPQSQQMSLLPHQSPNHHKHHQHSHSIPSYDSPSPIASRTTSQSLSHDRRRSCFLRQSSSSSTTTTTAVSNMSPRKLFPCPSNDTPQFSKIHLWTTYRSYYYFSSDISKGILSKGNSTEDGEGR